MSSDRVCDTFDQRYDLAKHVGPRREPRILRTMEGAWGRNRHYSLIRTVLDRPWPQWSSDGIFTGLRSRSSGMPIVS
jgi:hypothetical protein